MNGRTGEELKRTAERRQVARALQYVGLSDVHLVDGTRPDFIATIDDGMSFAVEITDTLRSDLGRMRALESAVARIHVTPVREYINSHGGAGAIITGVVSQLPQSFRDLESVRARWTDWLAKEGRPLQEDGGRITARRQPLLVHDFGCVTGVHRMDSLSDFIPIRADDEPAIVLPHHDISEPELEQLVLERLNAKIQRGYDRQLPLWLVLRSPIARIHANEALCAAVTRANDGVFQRIILFNDPEHKIQAGLLARACFDLVVC